MFFDNLLKCAIILIGLSQLASCAKFRCFNKVFTDHIDVDVNKPDNLTYQSNVEYFDINKKTYLFAHGYNFDPEGDLSKDLVTALLALGDGNVVIVDWTNEAKTAGGILEKLQISSIVIPNVERMGRAVGKALVKLTKMGMSKDIHFIGFDYGAHLAGYAGRECADGDLQLKEIIALDPTEFGFSKISASKPVDKTCASFVSVVHCDVGGYGMNRTLGDVDFWPNYGPYASDKSERRQPGCTRSNTDQEKIFGGNTCSHLHCVEFYVESLGHPYNFKGGRADSYAEFLKNKGIFDSTNYIGLKVDYNNDGNFYLTTNAASLYGRGNSGLN